MLTPRKGLQNIRTLTDLRSKRKIGFQESIFRLLRIRAEKNGILQKLDVLNSRKQKIFSEARFL